MSALLHKQVTGFDFFYKSFKIIRFRQGGGIIKPLLKLRECVVTFIRAGWVGITDWGSAGTTLARKFHPVLSPSCVMEDSKRSEERFQVVFLERSYPHLKLAPRPFPPLHHPVLDRLFNHNYFLHSLISIKERLMIMNTRQLFLTFHRRQDQTIIPRSYSNLFLSLKKATLNQPAFIPLAILRALYLFSSFLFNATLD